MPRNDGAFGVKHFPDVFLIFFSVTVAVHPISVHVSGG